MSFEQLLKSVLSGPAWAGNVAGTGARFVPSTSCSGA